MTEASQKELIEMARSVLKPKKMKNGGEIGKVGCALVTDKSNVYFGVSIDICCGIGFCAEHSAIAAMVTHGEFVIKRIVAVAEDGSPLPPCGRCRELIHQLEERNYDTEVIIGRNRAVRLRELLPYPFDEKK
jgi:cytidine deaminase